MRALAQRGIPGFKTASSRMVRDGAYAVREKWSDTYPPTTQIVHVGSGPKDPDYKVVDDTHPEYVVDEYLVVTQGPEIHTQGVSGPEAGGGTTESREPGKSGDYGWTDSAGFATYKGKGDKSRAEDGARPRDAGQEGHGVPRREGGREERQARAVRTSRRRKRRRKKSAEAG